MFIVSALSNIPMLLSADTMNIFHEITHEIRCLVIQKCIHFAS